MSVPIIAEKLFEFLHTNSLDFSLLTCPSVSLIEYLTNADPIQLLSELPLEVVILTLHGSILILSNVATLALIILAVEPVSNRASMR